MIYNCNEECSFVQLPLTIGKGKFFIHIIRPSFLALYKIVYDASKFFAINFLTNFYNFAFIG